MGAFLGGEMNEKKILRAIRPDVEPAEYSLDDSECTMGRAGDCRIVVNRPFSSRLHARIHWDGHYFVLEDNQSVNGTYVNGRRVEGAHKLKHGDEIGLGDPTGLLAYLDDDRTMQSNTRLRFDARRWRFEWDGQPVVLSTDQFALLITLYDQRGQTCDRGSCARAVWSRDYDAYMDADALDQVASRLRARLRQTDPEAADLLVTVRGHGYMLKHG
jgi:DNA-binding response OmpR family regulator